MWKHVPGRKRVAGRISLACRGLTGNIDDKASPRLSPSEPPRGRRKFADRMTGKQTIEDAQLDKDFENSLCCRVGPLGLAPGFET